MTRHGLKARRALCSGNHNHPTSSHLRVERQRAQAQPKMESRDGVLTKQHQLHLDGPFCRAGSSVGHVYVDGGRRREIEYTEERLKSE